MALINTTPIKLSEVLVEFNAPVNGKLTDLYSGGAYVPSYTENGSSVVIPAAANLKLTDFLGSANITITEHSVTSNSQNFSSIDLYVNSNGTLSFGDQDGLTGLLGTNEWTNPTNLDNSKFAAYVTQVSGDPVSGDSFSTVLPLTSNRNWGISASTSDTLVQKSGVINVSIMYTGSGNIIANASITLTATATGTL